MVDLSFLGGVFLLGLDDRQSGVPAEADPGPIADAAAPDFPEGWESYTYDQIRLHLRCDERSESDDDDAPSKNRLPALDDWNLLRQAFSEAVGERILWDADPVPPTLGYSLDRDVPYPPPYHAACPPGSGGCGVYASWDLRAGDLVHDGAASDVAFPDAETFRRFALSLPRGLACDHALGRARIAGLGTGRGDEEEEEEEEEEDPRILLALDASSLMRSGSEDAVFGRGEANALPSPWDPGRLYASRDIARGEEVLDGRDESRDGWEEVGL